jgi:predicted DsbA family dithiol-disulfide isomerase
LVAIANEVGLDRGRWDACVADPAQAAAIARNTSDALAAGITSTPTLRFGDQVIRGLPRTYGELATAIRSMVDSVSGGSGASPAGTP